MKNFAVIALAIVSTMSSSAFATSLRPRVTIAAVANVSREVKTITVDNYGQMGVELRATGEIVTDQLANANRTEIYYEAMALANAEIVTRHHQIVCMMALPQFLPMLQVSEMAVGENFTGELRDVLSVTNCAMSTTVVPENEYMLQRARALKQALTILGNELADADDLR